MMLILVTLAFAAGLAVGFTAVAWVVGSAVSGDPHAAKLRASIEKRLIASRQPDVTVKVGPEHRRGYLPRAISRINHGDE
jgi:hypothetical protein